MPKNGLLKSLTMLQPGLQSELSALQRDFADDMRRAADDSERLVLSHIMQEVAANVARQRGAVESVDHAHASKAAQSGGLRRVLEQRVTAIRDWVTPPSRRPAQWRLFINDLYARVPAPKRHSPEQTRRTAPP